MKRINTNNMFGRLMSFGLSSKETETFLLLLNKMTKQLPSVDDDGMLLFNHILALKNWY